MTLHRPARLWADLLATALAVWLGIHTLRTYLAMAGWVLGMGLNRTQLGFLLLGIWAVGLLAGPVARLLGGRRPPLRLGLIFALFYLLYHLLPGQVLSPLLGSVAMVAWLWLWAALLRSLALARALGVLLPGILLGLAGQVSLQASLHGLDLPQLIGLGGGLGSIALAGALLLTLSASDAALPLPTQPPTSGLPGWGLLAWGPFLALQLSLAANLGRVQTLSGWGLSAAAALVLGGLAAGLVALLIEPPFVARLLGGLAAIAIVANHQQLAGLGVWLLLPLQLLLALSAGPALSPHPRQRTDESYLLTAVGSLGLVVLLLLFYAGYEWKALWTAMTALAVLPGLLSGRRDAPPGAREGLATLAAAGGLGLLLSLLPRSIPALQPGPAPAEITVLTYNVHQLFNNRGVPGPGAIARVIEEADADLIALQEVGRGWNFTGGADAVAWLRWRFPQYQVHYGATEGDLVGNVLMSRYPIATVEAGLFPMLGANLQRGYLWAAIPSAGGDLLFVNTHLSAFDDEEEDRLNQAHMLAAFRAGRPRFILAGDLNAEPDSEPVQVLRQSGLTELTAPTGASLPPTYPAEQPQLRLDYLFGSADLRPVSSEVLKRTASDHRPVLVRIRLP